MLRAGTATGYAAVNWAYCGEIFSLRKTLFLTVCLYVCIATLLVLIDSGRRRPPVFLPLQFSLRTPLIPPTHVTSLISEPISALRLTGQYDLHIIL